LNECGDPARAIPYLVRALELARKADADYVFASWATLSGVLVDSGLYREAQSCSLAALQVLGSDDSPVNSNGAPAYANYAQACLFLGDSDSADRQIRRAIDLTPPVLDDKAAQGLASRLEVLFLVALFRSDWTTLKQQHEQIMAMSQRYGVPKIQSLAELSTGVVEVLFGAAQEGIARLESLKNRAVDSLPSLLPDCCPACYRIAWFVFLGATKNAAITRGL